MSRAARNPKAREITPVLTLQITRDGHRYEDFYRVECTGAADKDVRAALDQLLEDRESHRIGLKQKVVYL